MWSTIGQCAKFIGVVSENWPSSLLDSYSVEESYMTYDWPECRKKFAKITPINNVYWSHFRINRVKMLIVNLKSLEPLKFC